MAFADGTPVVFGKLYVYESIPTFLQGSGDVLFFDVGMKGIKHDLAVRVIHLVYKA